MRGARKKHAAVNMPLSHRWGRLSWISRLSMSASMSMTMEGDRGKCNGFPMTGNSCSMGEGRALPSRSHSLKRSCG